LGRKIFILERAVRFCYGLHDTIPPDGVFFMSIKTNAGRNTIDFIRQKEHPPGRNTILRIVIIFFTIRRILCLAKRFAVSVPA
ncbi:MAG: hypothetical protein NC241_11215, partial [Bacteroides sp.]|nr:hypothetical protein [Bacteroides sp.]